MRACARVAPMAGSLAVSGKTAGSKDCVVGPGDLPLDGDFKHVRCPTPVNVSTARKREFGVLSNPTDRRDLLGTITRTTGALRRVRQPLVGGWS